MAFYKTEPSFQHGTAPKIGILLLNLGTPDEPTPKAVRRYLKQFLSDRRVVEIPRLIWWIILNIFILNTRPKQSAEKYAQVWTKEGSPLLVHFQRQAVLLRGFLGQRISHPISVEIGMSYGNPSVPAALEKLRQQGCTRILAFPLFPQYAASSTGSAFDAVFNDLMHRRHLPELRTVRHYHDHPAYILALAENVRNYWRIHGQPEKLIISFHGVPRYTLDKGDPYHCYCHKTARLLVETLGLSQDQFMVCFQSRFGRAEWLKPYLAPTLEHLGKQKLRRIDVVCPGFSSDCLETLEEIAMEGKASFISNGGGEYHYIPALNENDAWIHAMADIALHHMQGWLDDAPSPEELEKSRQLAMGMGAKA